MQSWRAARIRSVLTSLKGSTTPSRSSNVGLRVSRRQVLFPVNRATVPGSLPKAKIFFLGYRGSGVDVELQESVSRGLRVSLSKEHFWQRGKLSQAEACK